MKTSRQPRTHQGQGNQGLRAVATGGTISVEVGPNDASITLTNNSTGEVSSIPTSPGKDTQVPIPGAPGGTVFTLRIGRGPTARVIVVEVIAPGP